MLIMIRKSKFILESLPTVAAFLLFSGMLSTVLFPAMGTDALGNTAGTEVGLNVKEFIKLAMDTSNLALKDSNNNTVIIPSDSGTLITGDVNLAVTTNTEKGYTLSVYTEDASTGMSHSDPNITTKINSISTATGYDAATGLSDLTANTSGFRKYTSGSYSNWFAIGANSANGTIIDSTNSDDSLYCDNLAYPLENTGCSASSYNTYQVNFGAKLTSALPAGTYSNNVVFSAIAKSEGTKYLLNFNSNGGIGSMGTRTILSGSTITMPEGAFTKEGKGIKGWALVNNATPSTTPLYTPGTTVQVNTLLSDATTAGQFPTTTNEVTLYAVWDTAYTVEFQYGAEDVTGTPFSETKIQSGTLTIPGYTAFTKEGYNQIGWALVENSTSATTPLYEEGQAISIADLITAASNAGQSVTPGSAGKIVLYGVWEIGTIYFQDTDSCKTIDVGTTGTLTDSRDDQEYTVYRWGSSAPSGMSNYCIMTQDLKLGMVDGPNASGADTTVSKVAAGGNMTLRSSDSTFDSTYTSGSSWDITYVNSANNGSGWSTTSSESNKQYTYGPKPGNEAETSHGYYSWGAALTACPKGWRLPTNSEYSNIASFMGGDNATGSSTIRNDTYNFVYGGYYWSGGWRNVGSNGYYWSSTQSSSTYGYNLYFYSSGLYASNFVKYGGVSVRCVAQ